jgi:hypothetical protein
VPALGTSGAGAPVALGGATGAPAGVGAPPLLTVAAAFGARPTAEITAANVNSIPADAGRTPIVRPTTEYLSFARLRG